MDMISSGEMKSEPIKQVRLSMACWICGHVQERVLSEPMAKVYRESPNLWLCSFHKEAERADCP